MTNQRFWNRVGFGGLVVLGLLTLSSGTSVSQESVRTWTDTTGKHKTKAEFVSADEEQVTLRKPGTDKTLTMPLSRLSEADREYVLQRLAALAAEAADEEIVAEEGAAEAIEEAIHSEDKPDSNDSKSVSQASRSQPNVINSVRGAVYRAQTRDQLRQIAIGLLNYEATHGRYPQMTAVKSSDGKSGLSWRVAILPMLDQNNLYQQFRLQEPWDSPHNKQLIAKMPKIFQSPGSSLEKGYTNYLGIEGPNTLLNNAKRPTKIANVTDGTSMTIMVVEADDTHAVIWTKPEDYPWDTAHPTVGLGNIWTGSFFATLADGSVHFVPLPSPEVLNGLFTINGGERVQLSD